MESSPELQIFTRIIATDPQGLNQSERGSPARLILQLSPKLQQSIESRWQAIVVANPTVPNPDRISQLLVADLFDRLNQNAGDLQIAAHWQAFLYDLALTVAQQIFRTVNRDRHLNIALQDLQSICLNTIVSPQHFFTNFNLHLSHSSDLLVSLRAYAYRAITYAAYPAIRQEFACPNIGRSNLSLLKKYSDRIIDRALSNIERDRAQIERDLALCRCTREYLRQMETRINLLQADDFQRIGELYQGITGDLPPPVRDRLEQIGEAIRHFTSLRIWSLDLPIGNSKDRTTMTMGINVISPLLQPEQELERNQTTIDCQNILRICDRWLVEHTQSDDRQIIYLRYHFQLKQAPIAMMMKVDQASISRRLRRIHLAIARTLMATINPDLQLELATLIQPIIEILQTSFNRLIIFRNNCIVDLVDIAVMDELAALIDRYPQSPPDLVEAVISDIGDNLKKLFD